MNTERHSPFHASLSVVLVDRRRSIVHGIIHASQQSFETLGSKSKDSFSSKGIQQQFAF